MILFEEALKIVDKIAKPLPVVTIGLVESLGHTLAEDVFSDMDMPPFDKSAVDGYACRRQDLSITLTVMETIPAGVAPQKTISPGQCSKIMTGGMMPQGADTVIMVEDVEVTGESAIRFTAEKTAANYCLRAEDIRKGDKALSKGTVIRAQEIAIMASVGCWQPLVYKQPVIGIISTGDELVEPQQTPSVSQIRNSNAWQLMAQAQQANCKAVYYGIARDTEQATFDKIKQAGESSDIVILTGGISAGDFDFVPQVIKEAGYQIYFRALAVQPGKPVIFAGKDGHYLVALPGNPVSSFVQFEMLVKQLIARITGNVNFGKTVTLPLGANYTRKRASRRAFFPVTLTAEGTLLPLEYHGSAHIHSYIFAQGIASIALGETEIKKGTLIDVRLV